MGQTAPEDLRAACGDRLDEESRLVLAEFEKLTSDLEGFHAEMSRLTPPVPQVDLPQKTNVVSFWRRPVLPAWSLPAAAAATFFLGVVVPTQPEKAAPVEEPKPEEAVREVVIDTSSTRFDEGIADAIFERGSYFMEQENHQAAYNDFKLVQVLNPNDERVLDYLLVVTAELKLTDEQKHYQDLKDKLIEE